ncbi:MAG: c-type cytochrome [Tepidisphaeraceae bacterium]
MAVPQTNRSRLTIPMLAIAAAVIIGGPVIAIGDMLLHPAAPSASERQLLAESKLPPLDAVQVASGRRLFQTACIACHGADAKGVPNMGKDLVASSFARGLSDADLVKFLGKGRGPGDAGFTGPMPMPARGGRADFTDEHLGMIVSYLRSLEQPTRAPKGELPDVKLAVLDTPPAPEAPAPTPPTPTATATASPAAVVPAVAIDADSAKRGQKVFANCIACHAKTGVGVKGVGADLVHSTFVAAKTDAELVAFIKKGRMPGDPETKLKLTMPPKGGNPALNDKQLADVVQYVRQLQSDASKQSRN